MPRLMVCGSLVLALLCSAPVRAQVAPQTLQPGKPLESELAAGRTDAYLVRLSANQIAHVVVEQKGVDLVISAAERLTTRLRRSCRRPRGRSIRARSSC